MNEAQFDVIVIGGGAAGMMAAIAAGKAGARVVLLERNEKLGKKVYITGKGRCNVTNAAEREVFFKSIIRNPRFLYTAFSRFDNNALMALIEEAGCPLKVERGERVFPVSDKASDITRALERLLKKHGVELRFSTRVQEILQADGRVCAVKTDTGLRFLAKSVILATGGLSYPSTGSTGDGYRLAKELGHTVLPCLPSLVPINTVEKWPSQLSGLTLLNVCLRAKAGGKVFYAEQGEMLLTHFGITGPLVLSLSAQLPQDCKGTQLEIDLKPALSDKVLNDRILRDIQSQPRATLATIVNGLVPRALGLEILQLLSLSPDMRVSEWKAADRRRFAAMLKALPLTVDSIRGYNEAVVTRGGVSTKEINPSRMESRLVQGLYFAGELIDIDALTGGYNLQLAFSTGHLAGECAAE